MRETKIWFGLLILFFFVVITLSPLGLKYVQNSRYGAIVTYNQTEFNSCHINSVEPTIILRMDDVRAYSKLTVPLVDEILDRELSITLGVIPKDLEKDSSMIKYLQGIKDSPYIEIAQHGDEHNESDINITEESLLEGYGKIQRVLGVVPVTYIPPYNDISEESKEIISNYFRVISKDGEVVKEGKRVAEIGQTIATYYYTTNEIVPTERIVSKCKESLDKTNVCVVTIHPQEYAYDINNAVVLSPERFDDFKELLDGLQELDAGFSTFKGVVYCSSE